jgi:hypothetical protein
MMATGDWRWSAYLSCLPKSLGLPRKTSARTPAAHAVAVHDGDDDRALRLGPDPALGAECGEQPVDADRHAGRGHRLTGEALHEVVVTPAARHAAELARTALLVEDFEGEFRLEHRTGVVAEAAHDGGVNDDAVRAEALGGEKRSDGFEFIDTLTADSAEANDAPKIDTSQSVFETRFVCDGDHILRSITSLRIIEGTFDGSTRTDEQHNCRNLV